MSYCVTLTVHLFYLLFINSFSTSPLIFPFSLLFFPFFSFSHSHSSIPPIPPPSSHQLIYTYTMSFISLRSLSTRAIQITNNKNAALLNCTRLYTAASTPAKFATIDESARAQKQMAFGRDLSAAASNAHGELRFDWKKEEIDAIYHSPIMELLYHGVSLSFLVVLMMFSRVCFFFTFVRPCCFFVRWLSLQRVESRTALRFYFSVFFMFEGVRFYFVSHVILHSDRDTTITTKQIDRQETTTTTARNARVIIINIDSWIVVCGHGAEQHRKRALLFSSGVLSKT